MADLSSQVGVGRLGLRHVGFIATGVVTVVTLAIFVPFAERVRWTHECADLGGHLVRSTETVEPLVVSRTVHVCYSPGGRVLDSW